MRPESRHHARLMTRLSTTGLEDWLAAGRAAGIKMRRSRTGLLEGGEFKAMTGGLFGMAALSLLFVVVRSLIARRLEERAMSDRVPSSRSPGLRDAAVREPALHTTISRGGGMRCEVVKGGGVREAWSRGLPEQLQDTVIAALEATTERRAAAPSGLDGREEFKTREHAGAAESTLAARRSGCSTRSTPSDEQSCWSGGAREGRIGDSTGSTSAKRMRSMIGTCANSAAGQDREDSRDQGRDP